MFTPPGAALPIADGPFDLVAGLPAHPLVVHVAVVILPLSALALIFVVLIPRARRPFAWITLVGLGVGAVAAWVAKESGEALAERVGTPQDHANLGGRLPLLAVVLLLIGIGWFVLQRSADGRRTVATVIAGGAAIIMSVAVIVLTVAVGHSGATAVWSGIAAATPAQQPAAAPTTSTPTAAGIFTLAEVADHSDRSSCWAAINGNVYDLTPWVGQHPGGADRILSICGTDATAAFTTQHGGQQRPEAELATFQIGVLTSGGRATASAGATAAATFTVAQVRKHAGAGSCWSTINGKVYDLTTWVNRHPGGASRILALCGTDGSSAFDGQHSGSRQAKAELRTLRIGWLAATPAA